MHAVVLNKRQYGDGVNNFSLFAAKLSDAKQLRGGIYFVDELPVTPSGKVLRRKVQDIAKKWHKEQSSI